VADDAHLRQLRILKEGLPSLSICKTFPAEQVFLCGELRPKSSSKFTQENACEPAAGISFSEKEANAAIGWNDDHISHACGVGVLIAKLMN